MSLLSTVGKSLFVATLAIGAFGPQARAQEEWQPSGPMTVIVSSGPGSAYDVMMRAMQPHWQEYFGVPLIVQNDTGGGGALALDRVANAAPDGRTFGFSSPTPYMREMMESNFPWNATDIPVFIAAETPPYVVTTSAESEFQTWDDVRNSDRPIRLGIGQLVTTELVTILDLRNHGVEIVTGLGAGAAGTLTMLLAGDIDLWITVASATFLDTYRAGDLRPLYVIDTQPDENLPDVPILRDLDMPENWRDVQAVRMWFLPIGTPQHIQEAFADRLRSLAEDPEISGWLVDNDFVRDWITGEEATRSLDGFIRIIEDNWDIYQEFGS